MPFWLPLQCEFFALEGLSQLLKTVEQVKADTQSGTDHPRHRSDHVLMRATTFSGQVVADVREFMGKKVYDTVIPRVTCAISEAPSLRQARCWSMTSNGVGSEAYLRLATEIIKREREISGRFNRTEFDQKHILMRLIHPLSRRQPRGALTRGSIFFAQRWIAGSSLVKPGK